jgi:hypothetical protein
LVFNLSGNYNNIIKKEGGITERYKKELDIFLFCFAAIAFIFYQKKKNVAVIIQISILYYSSAI